MNLTTNATNASAFTTSTYNTPRQRASVRVAFCAIALASTLALSACGKAPREATTAERTKAIAQSEAPVTDANTGKTAALATPNNATVGTVTSK